MIRLLPFLRRFALAGLVLAVAPAKAAERRYELGVQDRLRVHVYEWPALTGEFTIGPDGFLSMPLIGEIAAGGVGVSDLSRAISDRLKAKANLADLPDVAVDVLQYRPFYILGRVERAGEYPYRPGMMVLNAVSIAGGIYRRPEVSVWAAERDAIQATGDTQVAAVRLQELAAREARLRAEVQQLPDMPPYKGDGSADAKRFGEDERAIFIARKEQLANGLKVLAERVTLYDDEIKSLGEQGAAENRERAVIIRELDEVKGLVQRGLTPAPRVVPLERGVAQIDREIKENEAMVIRARQQINISRQMIATLKDERLTSSINELKSVQSQIVETQERLRMSRRMVRESETTAMEEESKPSQDSMATLSYSITRLERGEPKTFDAAETTPVLPGDIVNVLRADASTDAPRRRELSENASADRDARLVR